MKSNVSLSRRRAFLLTPNIFNERGPTSSTKKEVKKPLALWWTDDNPSMSGGGGHDDGDAVVFLSIWSI